MDNLLKEINENNKAEKLKELRNEISEQYKNLTGERIQFTDNQITSIINIYQDSKTLTLEQKEEILNKTIKDGNIRRFLLYS